MKAISMKCTRAEYASIREQLLKANIKESDDLFNFEGISNVYLTNDYGFNELLFSCVTTGRKVYETFDKNIFLRSCGIEVSNVKINLLKVEEALSKDTIVSINTNVKKDNNKKIFEKLNKLLKQLNKNKSIELGLKIDCDIEHEKLNFLDESFKITITGNKTK